MFSTRFQSSTTGNAANIISVSVCAVLALAASASAQTTHYVSMDGGCGGNTPCYATIQEAINASGSGDEIIVAPGNYSGFNNSGIVLNVTLRSSGGPDVTTLDGGGAGSVIFLTGTTTQLTLKGFTIANGNSTGDGGGIRGGLVPSITIDDCIFFNNMATTDGGAIGGSWSNLVITNSLFIGNSAGQDGGAIRGGGADTTFNAHIADCVFNNNTAGRRGGAIGHLRKTPVIRCTFEGNSAHAAIGGGGAIHVSGYATSVIANCHFTNNTATQGDGGAISMFPNSSSVAVDFITNCTFTGNTAALAGGGVFLGGASGMISSTLTGNTAATGGGAALTGTSRIDNCTISENESTGDGGGVRLVDTASIVNSMVTGNSAGGDGGGLWLEQASATACAVSGNTAEGSGGGMFMIGATATDCPITGNVAAGRGGGAYAQAGASHLINCEISTNTAGTTGGGIYIMDAALVNLIDSTVCPNTPDLIDFHLGGMLVAMNAISCEITCPSGDVVGACCLHQGGCATLSEVNCIAVGGTYQGDGTSCAQAECPAVKPTCIGDLNGDGVVDLADLLLLLNSWGICP